MIECIICLKREKIHLIKPGTQLSTKFLLSISTGAQQYNFTTQTWRQLSDLGAGFPHLGCLLLPQTKEKILAVGDLAISVTPVILDVANNMTVETAHTAKIRWGPELVNFTLFLLYLQFFVHSFILNAKNHK